MTHPQSLHPAYAAKSTCEIKLRNLDPQIVAQANVTQMPCVVVNAPVFRLKTGVLAAKFMTVVYAGLTSRDGKTPPSLRGRSITGDFHATTEFCRCLDIPESAGGLLCHSRCAGGQRVFSRMFTGR